MESKPSDEVVGAEEHLMGEKADGRLMKRNFITVSVYLVKSCTGLAFGLLRAGQQSQSCCPALTQGSYMTAEFVQPLSAGEDGKEQRRQAGAAWSDADPAQGSLEHQGFSWRSCRSDPSSWKAELPQDYRMCRLSFI